MLELRSGLIIADAALALACDLEARGHVMTAKQGALTVTNGSALTAADRASITRYRWHLLAIASYGQPEDTWAAITSEAHDSSIDRSTINTLMNHRSRQAASSTATSSKSTTSQSMKSTKLRGKRKIASSAFAWNETES